MYPIIEAIYWQNGNISMDLASLLIFIAAPALMAVVLIVIVMIKSYGPSAKVIRYVKAKKMRLLLHIGLDRAMHFLPAVRGINGNLKIGPLEFCPDPSMPDASFPLGTGEGIIAMLTQAQAASTLNAPFLRYAAFATKHLSPANNPKEARIALRLMENDEKFTKDRLQLFKQIFNKEKTMEEVKQQEASRLELDDDAKAIFYQEFQKAYGYAEVKTGNQVQLQLQTVQREIENEKKEKQTVNIPKGIDELEKHLAEIEKAKKITVVEENWQIQPVKDPKTGLVEPKLVRIVEVPIDYVKYFMPNGASPNDVHSYGANKEMQGLLEKEFTPGQAFKWITLGIVVLLIGVGVYIILNGLHIH